MILLLLLQLASPDFAVTPGLVRGLDQHTVCTIKWGKDARHVTEAMKRQVAKNYHMSRTDIKARGKGTCCEIDHKIPREIGGADDISNLWAQPWLEAQKKDVEENKWHRNVCSGVVTLAEAQDHFMHWGEKVELK